MAGRAPTLRLGQLTGPWAAVYRLRDAMEADADQKALTAWRALLDTVDLADVIAAAEDNPPPAGSDEVSRLRRQHLQQVLAAAVLGRLTLLARQPGWARFLAVLAALLADARAAGQQSGGAVASGSGDQLDGGQGAAGAAEEVTAYTLAAEALRGIAIAVARALLAGIAGGATATQLGQVARSVLSDALALTLAAASAIGAAFTAGLVQTYLTLGIGQLDFVTAGDGRVCATCADAEDQNPYPAAQVPQPPLHPNCRCTLQPASEVT